MRGSIRLGRFFGVPVYIHLTFLLLLGVLGFFSFARAGLAAAVSTVAMISAVFACVVLHEFGHVLAARYFGIPTRDVTLLPIGGLARLARMPEKPSQELVVALAGPAVNLAIAAALFPVFVLTASPFVFQLLAINIVLLVFNLLPAFPMDGGRVLRALMAQRMSYVAATNLAATIGRGMAILFGVAGLFGNPMLMFIAVFVWFGAGQEAAMARQQAYFSGRGTPLDPEIIDPSRPRTVRVYRVEPWGTR